MANLDLTTVAPKIAQAKAAGYSDDEITNFLSSQAPDQFKQAKDAGYSSSEILGHLTTSTEAPRAWSDVPLEALKNIPSSAAGVVTGAIGQAANVAKTAAPYLAQGIVAPQAAALGMAKALYQNPDLIKSVPADAWKGLVDKYGSEEAIKKTIATDPVGFAMDVATLIGGGEAALSRVTRGVGEIARTADVSKPFYERATPPTIPPTPPPLPPPELEPGQAAVRQAVESQPRALTTDKWWQQQAGQVFSKIPFVGSPIGRVIEAVPGKFGEARTAIADEQGGYRTPQNVAADIGQHIGGAAEAETQARTTAARQADEAAQAEYERTNQAREQAIAQREQQSAQATQRQAGDVTPTDMGDTIIDTVRANHEAVRAAKDAAYQDAGNREGMIFDTGVGSADRHVTANLRSDQPGRGIVTTEPAQLTPAANSMRQSLAEFSGRARERRAAATQDALAREQQRRAEAGDETPINIADIQGDVERTGLNLQRIEQQRKLLNNLAGKAELPADQRAAGAVMDAFDEWQQRAMQGRHYEGDPTALRAFQDARAANRDFRQRFGYNKRNDADAILNKIVQPGERIGPNDIANALTATRADKSGRLLDAVYQATGDHPDHPNVVQAVRGGLYNKLTRTDEGVPHPPERTARNIGEFLGRREMANRVYSPQDQALFRAHADTLRAGPQAREEATALARANRPVPTEVIKGPAQELADRVLGRGQKAPEAIYDTIEGYAKSKGGGKDIATLARVMGSLPQELRGNFRNTFIRRIGTGLKGDFSPAKFADEWNSKINPQAKAVLFGDGAHVRALDELAAASKKFDEVHRRFGNPSGSGHTVNFARAGEVAAAAATGTLLGPLYTMGGWFAGRQFAHFLATPQGAASASRFVRQMQRLQDVPSLANAAATRLSVRNMRNTATALGIEHNIPDQK